MATRKMLANAVRALSMDAIQRANSGHPGAPLGMADIAEVLWNDFLKHNPANPSWPDRDRFVFSNGHGSMLLYSLLHLSGYDLSIDDIKNFRQLHSKTPGHPEHGVTPGVESTSGPLGQGVAAAVGMAVAEKVLSARFNREGHAIVDHYTYVFMGDGCMMEGISHECCSLAGTLGLGKLISVYDDNEISIDGCVEGWFQDDTPKRFEAYGWHVVRNVDGHDPEAVRRSLAEARAVTDRPSLICCKTVIGQGAPNVCGTEKCHGAPLGEEEISCARDHLGWSHGPFEIPDAVYAAWDARPAGAKAEAMWNERMAAYETDHPELAAEFRRRMAGALPDGFSTAAGGFVRKVQEGHENLATRKASQKSLEGFGPLLPELIGGSADLAGSNLTRWSGSRTVFGDTWDGNYINFGVREFAMAAMMNGLALHGGFIPYGGTFLVFADYARNAIRMAAMMGIRTIYVLTHDSIGVGEDGPTHQPVEHVASLRLIPNLHVWRPCDAVESAAAWKAAIERSDGPSALVFSRQTLKHNDRDAEALAGIARGGYVLRDCPGEPQAIIMATGSEVGLAVDAADALLARGHQVRVVSLPCLELFEAQDSDYRNSVLPPEVTARVAVEAGSPDLWHKYVG
ncbi:MAG: transketolase, partial [Desulfohalobiaceae bacterium]